METVQSVYFCFGAKPANSKFATKTAKKKCENCHIETTSSDIWSHGLVENSLSSESESPFLQEIMKSAAMSPLASASGWTTPTPFMVYLWL